MSDKNEYQDLVDRLRILPDLVAKAVRGLNDEQLDTPYGEGKWTVRQVVHHLADSHANANARFKLTMTEDRPNLQTYDQDRWATLGDMNLPLEPSLEILRGIHRRWASLLGSLPTEAWNREADHREDGVYTLRSLVTVYAEHGEKHVKQITDLRQRMGW